jgi:hypothetical protein
MCLFLKSSFLCSGNILRPDTVSIAKGFIILKKREPNYLFSKETIIPVSKVGGLKIHRYIIGSDIEIYGLSSKLIITLKGFSLSDAKRLKECLQGNYNIYEIL